MNLIKKKKFDVKERLEIILQLNTTKFYEKIVQTLFSLEIVS